ncbi:MAG TPA: glycosyltransferase, partial [Gemmatimonadales bacterium]|nr:glycosyltransferase [Gemmatimonadales bacterium]
EGLHAHTALRRRALERLGCRVTSFNLMGAGGWLSRLRRIGLHDRLGRAVSQTAPDLVLVLEGCELPASVVAQLRQAGTTWVNWFCDGRRSAPVVLEVAAAYDFVFVAGSAAVGALGQPGLPPIGYLPPGCDPSVHRPMRSRDQFRANVVFVGTATAHRERMLAELVEYGLAIWGPGWRRTKLRDYCRGEVLDQADYVRAYAGASVAVNVPCSESSGPDGDTGCNRRLFELAAIGVPQVVEDRPDLHAHFNEGSEVLVARDPADLKSLVREALQDRVWAEEVAGRARRRAMREHTYMHRMRALLGAVQVGVGV